MRKPPYLVPGDTIYLVAPSFGCTIKPYMTRLKTSIANFKKKGFKVIEGPNIWRNDGVVASAPAKERAEEIHKAFESEAKLIIAVGGGELMIEILPYIDFERIKACEPKWFMGFSDPTNLVFTLATNADLVSVYGPGAAAYFQKKWRYSEEDAFRLLMGETHFEGYPKWSISKTSPAHPLWSYRMSQEKKIVPHGYEKPFEGTLLGGCMDCLLAICGTKFDKVKEFNAKHPEGVIWYLETCDLNPLAIRRGYFQLKEAGWFDNAKGFLLGRAKSGMEEALGLDRFEAAIGMLGELGKPILMDVDIGHLKPSMPIKNGAYAKVSFTGGNLVIDYKE